MLLAHLLLSAESTGQVARVRYADLTLRPNSRKPLEKIPSDERSHIDGSTYLGTI